MPLPDYIITSDPDMVRVVLYGKILDERYTRLLIRQTNLSLDDIILLDKLQKGLTITKEAADQLRKSKLIEGRYPRVYPAADIAVKTEKIEEYLENKGYDDAFYIQKILEYLCQKGHANRQEITRLIKKHLSQQLTDEQKNKKIGNLLSVKMASRMKVIVNTGSRSAPAWELTDTGRCACKKANPSCKKDCKKGICHE